MKYITGSAIALLFVGVVVVASPTPTYAQTSSIAEMLAVIQDLMKQIRVLEARLNEVRGEVRDTIKVGLEEGMTDNDIKQIQELLATDPSIYPHGLATGYFGPLTREALMRFQQRHELTITGQLDEETRELLQEYLSERFGENVPPGLLRAPGIQKKIELRIREGCDHSGRGKAFLCNKLKIKYRDSDDDDSDDDSNTDKLEVEVEIETEDEEMTTVHVHFTFDTEEYDVELESTDEDDVLGAVAEALDVDTEDLDGTLADKIKEELADELNEDTED